MKFNIKIIKHGKKYRQEIKDKVYCPECHNKKLSIGKLNELKCENCGCWFFAEINKRGIIRFDPYDFVEIKDIHGNSIITDCCPPPKLYFG